MISKKVWLNLTKHLELYITLIFYKTISNLHSMLEWFCALYAATRVAGVPGLGAREDKQASTQRNVSMQCIQFLG